MLGWSTVWCKEVPWCLHCARNVCSDENQVCCAHCYLTLQKVSIQGNSAAVREWEHQECSLPLNGNVAFGD